MHHISTSHPSVSVSSIWLCSAWMRNYSELNWPQNLISLIEQLSRLLITQLKPHCKTVLMKSFPLWHPIVWAAGLLMDGATEVWRELQPLSCSDWEARSVMCQLSQDRPAHGLPQRVLRSPQTAGRLMKCVYVYANLIPGCLLCTA